MRTTIASTILGAILLAAFSTAAQAAETKAGSEKAGKLRHVVLLKFKEDTPAEEVSKIEKAFAALPSKIPTIVDFEWGTNNSPEGLAQGFTHCFLVTFENEKGRAVYLPHPAHKAFVTVLMPHLDKVLVVDYVAQQ
jgi:hypothetical protein